MFVQVVPGRWLRWRPVACLAGEKEPRERSRLVIMTV
jgi:hypothetical protein